MKNNVDFLVTGGAGFIGSNIVVELLKRGYSVRVLDNFSTGRRENIKEFESSIELIEGDIRSYHIVQKAVKGIKVILHQAALPSVPRSIDDPITTNEVNVTGTLNMLNASVEGGVKRFVLASSSSIYGDIQELKKHEGIPPNPLSPYAVTKLVAEKYCCVFAKIYGLETVALRYFNVFGPKQDPASQYSAVIPKFIKLMMNNKSPLIYGNGEQSRDFTYVDNVVECNIRAATMELESGLVMNCACQEQTTLNELVSQINSNLGKKITPNYAEHRNGDIMHSMADITLAKTKLKYTPKVLFSDGLKSTIDFFRKQIL